MADKETEKMIEGAEKKDADEEEAKAQEVIKAQAAEEAKLRALPPRERRAKMRELEEKRALENWIPKTSIGREVKTGKLKDIDALLDRERRILEPQMIDLLIPNLQSDLILIGQAKGKFGGGKRRAWRQTQRKTKEGNVLTFSSMAIVGDGKNHIGLGYGRAKETLPAREKGLRQAKLNLFKIEKGFETPEPDSNDPHTVPYKVTGKAGSVRVTLMPAARGTGLVIGDEGKKILKLAGIKDVYATTKGKTKTTFNLAKAVIDALKKTGGMEL
jgi:small subunit ribosomal protein S5